MYVVSRLRRVLVCLAGIALAGTVLAESSPGQNVPPQVDCSRWGYGPGMMGYGAGPGMMRGYGMGMGPGAMMPGGWAGGLDLSDEQRTKINRIQDETRRSHWALMGSMMDQQAKLRDLYDAPKRDSAAIDSTYKTIDGIRQQMLSSSADARKRIEAVLTKEQLEKLRTYRSQQDELGW